MKRVVEGKATAIELLNYSLHTGVLGSPEDFESSEDVYEALGGVLQGAAEDTSEKAVRDMCRRLYTVLRG